MQPPQTHCHPLFATLAETLQNPDTAETWLAELLGIAYRTHACSGSELWLCDDDNGTLVRQAQFPPSDAPITPADTPLDASWVTELRQAKWLIGKSHSRFHTPSSQIAADIYLQSDGIFMGVARFLYPKNESLPAEAAAIWLLVQQAFHHWHLQWRAQSHLSAFLESEQRFHALANSSGAAIFAFRRQLIYANKTTEQLTGLTQDVLKSLPLALIFGEGFTTTYSEEALKTHYHPQALEIEFEHSSGEIRWAYISLTQAEFDGSQAWLASAFDITERKRSEIYMRYSAYHDNLTGLPNRLSLIEKINRCLVLASRDRYYRFGFSAIQFVKYSQIQKARGGIYLDQWMIDTALILKQNGETGDYLARLADDTFVIMSESRGTGEKLLERGQQLAQILQSQQAADRQKGTHFAIGLLAAHAHFHHAEEVIRHIHYALEQACEAPTLDTAHQPQQVALFDESYQLKRQQKRSLAGALRQAIESQQITIAPDATRFIYPFGSNRLIGSMPSASWRDQPLLGDDYSDLSLFTDDIPTLIRFAQQLSGGATKPDNNTLIWLDFPAKLQLPLESVAAIIQSLPTTQAHCLQIAPQALMPAGQAQTLHDILQKHPCSLALALDDIPIGYLTQPALPQTWPIRYLVVNADNMASTAIHRLPLLLHKTLTPVTQTPTQTATLSARCR